MFKQIVIAAAALLCLPALAQTYTTPYSRAEQKKATRWVKKGTWRNGFKKASPDKTVNAADFRRQYERNPEQWKALFRWLQNTDLMALSAGQHAIAGTGLTASVQDDVNKPLSQCGSESHRKKIDVQYVVSGTEGFAVLEHESSTPRAPYNEKWDVINYNYTPERLRLFTNRQGHFNIFFPGDWHIAKVQTGNALGDKKFRVIVIKVDYKD